MANDLVVSSSEEGLQIAVMENRRLVELQIEAKNNDFAVGDIFLGRVKRVLPGLNAVFVDIGYSRDAFLHYLDLGPQILTQNKLLRMLLSGDTNTSLDNIKPEKDIDKHGKVGHVLKSGDVIAVQIMKEAISSKGPRLSSQMSLAGQYMILMPFSQDVAISRKFKSGKEKRALKKYLLGKIPPNCGVIVRTAAEGVDYEKLDDELQRLVERWDLLTRTVIGSRPPKKILSEMNRTESVLRDLLALGYDNIFTDDKEIYKEIQTYLNDNLPEKRKILSLRKPRRGTLFESFGIERQIKAAFGTNVNLNNGAYIVIEHTEALHTIDINSGSLKVNSGSPEDNALRINMSAAREVARQLRLRDMGGIIVVDFIDQRKHDNQRAIYREMKREMAKDRAKHQVLPMSKFGLMQITRQRVRPEVNIQTDEVCPTCQGTGKIGSSILIADEVEKNVEFLITKNKIKSLKLQMNPYLEAYFTKGNFLMFGSRQWKWFRKYGKWVKVEPSNKMPFTEVQYIDANEEPIKLDFD